MYSDSIPSVGRPLAILFILTLFLMAAGCSSERDDLSNWSLKNDSLTLEEDLFLSGADDYYFGRITAMDVDNKGRMFVADGSEQEIKMLSFEGELLRVIGQQGKGPGEFRAISDIVVKNDSIFVLDSRLQRLSVYHLDGNHLYDHSVASKAGMPGKLLVPENKKGFVIQYTPSFCHGAGEENMRISVLRLNNRSEVADTLFDAPCREALVNKSNGAIQVLSKPFGRRPMFAMGTGSEIYYGWSDSLAATQYNLEGKIISSFSLPHDPIQVTKEDLEDLIAHRSETFQKELREGSHDTKPAFEAMLVDQEHKVWFKRSTVNLQEAIWWVVDRDIREIYTTKLPADIKLLQIKNGYAYGRTESDIGEPSVIRYNILLPS